MRCWAVLGKGRQALRRYEEMVELLDEQLGTPPVPQTVVLHERLHPGEEAQG